MSRKCYIRLTRLGMYLATAITAGLTLFLAGYVLAKGIPALSWNFLTTKPSYLSGNIGILPDILNTLYIVIATLVIVIPLGVGAAVYLTEYAGNQKLVSIIEYAAEALSGIPSIIYGLVGMLMFAGTFGTSLMAGALTLVIMNLPTILRNTQESLKTVPQSYREGAFGLGAGKWRDGGAAGLRGRCHHRLHPLRRQNSGRIRRPAVHRRICPRPQRLLGRSAQRRCDPDGGAVCLRQGAGGISGSLRHRRHFAGAVLRHQPGRRGRYPVLSQKERNLNFGLGTPFPSNQHDKE